jgi:hypothetical protein
MHRVMEQRAFFVCYPGRKGLDTLANAKERDKFANRAGVNQGFGFEVRRIPPPRVVDREDTTRFFAHPDNRIAIFQAQGKRLFAKNALCARGNGCFDNGAVQTRMGGNADNVESLFLEHLAIVEIERIHAPLLAEVVEMRAPAA